MINTQIKVPVFVPYMDSAEEEMMVKALRSKWVAQGSMVETLEEKIAEYSGVQHAVAVSSCTTALHTALLSMGAHEWNDVIVPSYTFVATANVVEQVGATAVLADVRPDTYCIDTDHVMRIIKANYVRHMGKLRNKNTSKELFGIIPVHIFGLCADMPAINAIAEEYDLQVLEDSACALGSRINGVHQGAFGNPSCLSFHARKSITTGEGGMILTDDAELNKRMKMLRSHNASVSEISRHHRKGYLMPDYDEPGYNYRLTDIQAAIGVAQMDKIDHIISRKRALAKRYDEAFADIPWLEAPCVPEGYYHSYQSYVVMLNYKNLGLTDVDEGHKFRNNLMGHLEDMGVSTRQGTHAVHLLKYYRNKYGIKSRDLPGAEMCDKLSISLPLYVDLSNDVQDYVIDMIKACKEKT